MTPGAGDLFAPLEASLREDFLPNILLGRIEEVIESLHRRITWDVRRAGIGIPYLTRTAPANVETSEHCCEILSALLLNREAMDLRGNPIR